VNDIEVENLKNDKG